MERTLIVRTLSLTFARVGFWVSRTQRGKSQGGGSVRGIGRLPAVAWLATRMELRDNGRVKPVIKALCWLGLGVPIPFVCWAIWEDMRAADEYKIAWQSYWMDRPDDVSDPTAKDQFLAAHSGIGESRAAEILVTGAVTTFTYYFALLGPGMIVRLRIRRPR